MRTIIGSQGDIHFWQFDTNINFRGSNLDDLNAKRNLGFRICAQGDGSGHIFDIEDRSQVTSSEPCS